MECALGVAAGLAAGDVLAGAGAGGAAVLAAAADQDADPEPGAAVPLPPRHVQQQARHTQDRVRQPAHTRAVTILSVVHCV